MAIITWALQGLVVILLGAIMWVFRQISGLRERLASVETHLEISRTELIELVKNGQGISARQHNELSAQIRSSSDLINTRIQSVEEHLRRANG